MVFGVRLMLQFKLILVNRLAVRLTRKCYTLLSVYTHMRVSKLLAKLVK